MHRALIVLMAVLIAGCGAGADEPGQAATAKPAAETPVQPLDATDESAQDDTPQPTAAAPAFKAINLKGSGNKVAKFKIPEDAAAIASITYTGKSNFIVESIDSSGSTNDLLVNTIGAYKGTRLFDASEGEHSVAFKIDAAGKWTIKVQPLTAAKIWSGAAVLKGTGDAVFLVSPATSGLTTAVVKHSGKSNFVVVVWSPDGSDLLVNEIGKFSGEQLLAEGTFLLEIEADGAWSITPS